MKRMPFSGCRTNCTVLFIALAAFLTLCPTVKAQQTSGSVVGLVTDNTGAVVAGSSVILTNIDTADRRTDTTDANGNYQFVNVIPGNYSVSVESAGFKRFVRSNVVVQVQGSTRVDAGMELGNVSETVEVSSQAPLMETQQATVGQVVAGRAVTELPLNGRNIFNLLALSPGVVPQGGTQAGNAVSGMNGNGFSTGNYQLSGGIPNTGAEFIDGAPINNGYINAISYIPAQDSIQEFRVESNAIGPEFGGTTNGVVTMVTKSGTNAFHGTAYDFLRNTVFNANNFFSNRAHLARPVLIQNQFGATVGGPIKVVFLWQLSWDSRRYRVYYHVHGADRLAGIRGHYQFDADHGSWPVQCSGCVGSERSGYDVSQ
jgi:hypothetical protein